MRNFRRVKSVALITEISRIKASVLSSTFIASLCMYIRTRLPTYFPFPLRLFVCLFIFALFSLPCLKHSSPSVKLSAFWLFVHFDQTSASWTDKIVLNLSKWFSFYLRFPSQATYWRDFCPSLPTNADKNNQVENQILVQVFLLVDNCLCLVLIGH